MSRATAWSYELVEVVVPELEEADCVTVTRRWWRWQCRSSRRLAHAGVTIIGGRGSGAHLGAERTMAGKSKDLGKTLHCRPPHIVPNNIGSSSQVELDSSWEPQRFTTRIVIDSLNKYQ
jgi:hypothetical protein